MLRFDTINELWIQFSFALSILAENTFENFLLNLSSGKLWLAFHYI